MSAIRRGAGLWGGGGVFFSFSAPVSNGGDRTKGLAERGWGTAHLQAVGAARTTGGEELLKPGTFAALRTWDEGRGTRVKRGLEARASGGFGEFLVDRRDSSGSTNGAGR